MTNERKIFYGKAISISWPIVLQNLLEAAVSSSDVLMLNFVGSDAISAANLAGQATTILFMFYFGLCAGTTMLCAQYYGKKDYKAIHAVEGIALRFSIIVSAIFCVISVFFPRYFMLIYTSEETIIDLGIQYLRIVGWGYLFWSVTEVYKAVLKSVERVKICSVVNMTTFVANIFFNAVFIFGLFGAPKMGVAGVALGTTISRFLELVLCIIISVKSKDVKMKLSFMFIRNKLLMKDFFHLSLPALLNDVTWGLAFSMYSAILGHAGGSDVTSANAIVQTVRNFGTTLCYGVGSATGIILGNEMGEGKLDTAMEHAKCMMRLTVISGAIGGVIVLAITPLTGLFNLTETAAHELKWMLLINTYYIMGTAVNTTLITGVFRSGGDSRFGFICDLIDMWGYAVPVGALAAFVFKLPVLVVYFLLCTDEFVKWPWVLKHYRSGKWIRDITRENVSAESEGQE